MTHSPKRFALHAALRFMGLSKSWATHRFWREFCTTVAFDVDAPTFSCKRYSQNPEIRLHLRPDWMTAVHLRGLDRLPTSPGAGILGDQLLILHAGTAHFVREDELVAESVWTRGRKPARGYIAWCRDPVDRSRVSAWAVGRTAQAAQEGLDQWPKLARADSADAMAMASLRF